MPHSANKLSTLLKNNPLDYFLRAEIVNYPLLIIKTRRCSNFNIYQTIHRRHCVQGSPLPVRQLDRKLLVFLSINHYLLSIINYPILIIPTRRCTNYNTYQTAQRRQSLRRFVGQLSINQTDAPLPINIG